MGELIQPVKNGQIEKSSSSSVKENKSKNTLGKDAFLQLLVTQMKYQDPLNPSSNTEYVAQLATFSQLEQMQNLNAMATNSQALSLVGKYVVVKTTSDTGYVNYIDGRVDYVTITNGKAKLSVDGKLYSVDDLDTVLDDNFVLEKGRPRIDKKADLVYDENPQDLSFEVYLGEGEAKADAAYVIVNNTLLDSSVVSVKDNKVVIDKSVFAKAPNGTYKITVIFNDPLSTVVKDMITITVKNSKAVSDDEQPDDEKPVDDDKPVNDEKPVSDEAAESESDELETVE